MPIYEYQCAACSHQFEEWQQMADKPIRTCPKCKKRKVERLMSATSFQLKGGGWYADGYASNRSSANGSSQSSETTSSSSKDSATSSAKKAKPAKKGASAKGKSSQAA